MSRTLSAILHAPDDGAAEDDPAGWPPRSARASPAQRLDVDFTTTLSVNTGSGVPTRCGTRHVDEDDVRQVGGEELQEPRGTGHPIVLVATGSSR
ncbi:MAG TPA: hypothetical protein VMV41_07130 [Cellulomonadaceae bacterium]|nr:hypothetical protein [Cellulomonadaceae bacterium]